MTWHWGNVFWFLIGAIQGWALRFWWVGWRASRGASRRRDDASRFERGMIITLGDGSRLRVVETMPHEGDGNA